MSKIPSSFCIVKESEQPTGNIKALKSNEKIIGLLQDIFKAGDLDDLFKQLL